MESRNLARELLEALMDFRRLGRGNKFFERLSFGEMAIFRLLAKQPVEGEAAHRLSVGELSTHLLMSGPAASQAVSRLEEKGLVERQNSRDDRRCVYIALTEKGRQYYDAESNYSTRLMRGIVEEMGEKDTAQLIRLMRKFDAIAHGSRQKRAKPI